MKIFLDTANIDEIRSSADIGIVDGVTTNPTLLAREKDCGDFREVLKEICTIVDGPVNAEVTGDTKDEMFEEGMKLARLHENIVVKIPMTREGLKAVNALHAEGIHTNVTLIFSTNQALLAAKAGAHFVSPFVGRLDDIGTFGVELIRDIVTVYANYSFECEVIAASLRSPTHATDCAVAGAHIATVPKKVLDQMFLHPLTDRGIAQFLKDWESTGAKI
ncbi:MAG: fructose-6-phosphate aldolase [Gemmatimonadota bacterium]|jgi:transaldolase|nr:fructose-6-phosphate aldolase [Gemmatimonadota bacterium]MDP6461381.1 fructose-6-phosphate aldolase [Gemmatimonadota bacterium]MDP6528151.1 fructose-6-phosphate aldolase [Gemmatimonadota bacterium]MDP6801761.1 fructose-6-phosphate aldolase [Gemmatimonadota bacterium]MDP7031163.1 fructose-6-phosphate aldolase [Gemmatimonadota bacterium]